MSNILETIAEATRRRIEKQKEILTPEQAATKAASMEIGDFPFEKALAREDVSFICECKKASPSKGLISPDFPYLSIAKDYESAGADAISVLTEPEWFRGSDEILHEISSTVQTPCLRKDFVVDPYMIDQAKILGAKAVLLICAILTEQELIAYQEKAWSLGLSALVEAHDEEEIAMAVSCGARIIGVNNRDLRDFTVDVRNSIRLRKLVPDSILFVSESGIETAADIDVLREAGADAALIGETLMRAEDRQAALLSLRGTRV